MANLDRKFMLEELLEKMYGIEEILQEYSFPSIIEEDISNAESQLDAEEDIILFENFRNIVTSIKNEME